MQDEINQKTVVLALDTAKVTARTLASAIRLYLSYQKNKQPKIYHGKQSIKQLMKQNSSLSNIEVTEQNIKQFERFAKKYNIDYALKQDTSNEKSRYLVFFKGRDVEVINLAFREFSESVLKDRQKPSVKTVLSKLKEQFKQQNKHREKSKERNIER